MEAAEDFETQLGVLRHGTLWKVFKEKASIVALSGLVGSGSTGAGASEKGEAGYKEGGGGQETSSPSRTLAAGCTVVGAPQRGAEGHEEGGGGQETSSPSRTFAAGGTVAEAPEEGATSQEDMGGGGPPTMATPMDYSRPLFQDIETEGGGGRWGHVCFAQGGGYVAGR
ncbi:UNVERIFIED_CONTAM: hypothetical protein FKN15_065811 [Acipenser sinensis]